MDPNKIITRNVRGLNSSVWQDSLRTLVDSSKADIVCVQETKIANLSQRVILSALGTDFSDFVVLPAPGQSGGILMACRHMSELIELVGWTALTYQFSFRQKMESIGG
jgi:exonuclease III